MMRVYPKKKDEYIKFLHDFTLFDYQTITVVECGYNVGMMGLPFLVNQQNYGNGDVPIQIMIFSSLWSFTGRHNYGIYQDCIFFNWTIKWDWMEVT